MTGFQRFIFILVSSFITVSCYGQSIDVLQKKADSLFKAKDFRNAAIAFSRAADLIPTDQPFPLFRTRHSACRAWTTAAMPDSAFRELNLLSGIKNLSFVSLTNLTSDQALIPLHLDPRWNDITKKLFEAITREVYSPLDSTYTQEEIIYGRKDGMALTMLRLKPKGKANGKSIIQIRSGGWGSNSYMPNSSEALPFLANGYNVFIVFHGSEPVYSVADVIEDLQRAVRFIRYNSRSYSLDPNKIGAMGTSAGGHLALMCGLSDSTSVAASPDPVDRMSSKVQAVFAFSATIDFFNWDNKGKTAFSATLFKQYLVHVLEFRKWDVQRRRFTPVTDAGEINKILKQISPTNHVTPGDAPVLLFHGQKDELVPVQQADLLVSKLNAAKVPVSYTSKKDGGHLWALTDEEKKEILNWFNKWLK